MLMAKNVDKKPVTVLLWILLCTPVPKELHLNLICTVLLYVQLYKTNI